MSVWGVVEYLMTLFIANFLKIVIAIIKYLTPQLKHVTTLLCEVLMSENLLNK